MDTMKTKNDDRVNLKVTVAIRKKVRMIAAQTGEPLMAVIDRLATQELKKLEREEGQK